MNLACAHENCSHRAGIIGVTTAYELAADGHEVTVFERRSAAAEVGSFANAGVVAPGCAMPWAASGMPQKAWRQLLNRHAPARLSLPLSKADLNWMRQWHSACQRGHRLTNRSRMRRLALYSRERLYQLTVGLGLDCDSSQGYTVLLRHEKDHRRTKPLLDALKDAGVAFHELTPDQVRAAEPALAANIAFMGGIALPNDGVANCRQLALLLKAKAQALGVHFEFNKAVAHIKPGRPAHVLIANETQPRGFEHTAACAGAASASRLQPLGLPMPMATVYDIDREGLGIGRLLGAPNR